MRNLLLGAAGGAVLTSLAAYLLYAAPERMRSGYSVANGGIYYTVGDKRFDYFRKSGPNCWGGHTLDGRCVTLVGSSGWYRVNAYNDAGKPVNANPVFAECVDHQCDKDGFLIASPSTKRKVARECPDANPLYVEKYGACPGAARKGGRA